MLNSEEMIELIDFLSGFNKYTSSAFYAGREGGIDGSFRRQENYLTVMRSGEKEAKELHQLLKTRLNNFTYNGDFS